MDEESRSYFGKYRGTVAKGYDETGLGRLQVSVPDVLGDGRAAWAMPCTPYAGKGQGFFAMPPVGANVWVEFERGDPDYPIWSGCFWGPAEAPEPLGGPQQSAVKILQSEKVKLRMDDLLGSLNIEVKLASGMAASIEAKADGLTITWGTNSVKLAPDGVSINGSNLKVLP
jgi:uncharacterized protein involved in type VI secretion and phage assembly